MKITVYTVEDKAGEIIWNEATSPFHGDAASEFEQYEKAKTYAQGRKGRVMANEFEFSGASLAGGLDYAPED